MNKLLKFLRNRDLQSKVKESQDNADKKETATDNWVQKKSESFTAKFKEELACIFDAGIHFKFGMFYTDVLSVTFHYDYNGSTFQTAYISDDKWCPDWKAYGFSDWPTHYLLDVVGDWYKSLLPAPAKKEPVILSVSLPSDIYKGQAAQVFKVVCQLPDNGYQPRMFDPRAGYFELSYYDYATPIQQPLTQRYITRHRLHKKDPTAARSEAVEPIIYYLDPGSPEPIRSALLDGARWWNQAFEAAGYIQAFRVEMLPADADPMDVRYNLIQWVHRSTRGWSYGSSVIDPRTGEIIKGQVTLGSLRVRQDFLIAQGYHAAYKTTDWTEGPLTELALGDTIRPGGDRLILDGVGGLKIRAAGPDRLRAHSRRDARRQRPARPVKPLNYRVRGSRRLPVAADIAQEGNRCQFESGEAFPAPPRLKVATTATVQ